MQFLPKTVIHIKRFMTFRYYISRILRHGLRAEIAHVSVNQVHKLGKPYDECVHDEEDSIPTALCFYRCAMMVKEEVCDCRNTLDTFMADSTRGNSTLESCDVVGSLCLLTTHSKYISNVFFMTRFFFT